MRLFIKHLARIAHLLLASTSLHLKAFIKSHIFENKENMDIKKLPIEQQYLMLLP